MRNGLGAPVYLAIVKKVMPAARYLSMTLLGFTDHNLHSSMQDSILDDRSEDNRLGDHAGEVRRHVDCHVGLQLLNAAI